MQLHGSMRLKKRKKIPVSAIRTKDLYSSKNHEFSLILVLISCKNHCKLHSTVFNEFLEKIGR